MFQLNASVIIRAKAKKVQKKTSHAVLRIHIFRGQKVGKDWSMQQQNLGGFLHFTFALMMTEEPLKKN